MARGGIYDQLAGGFARYSVDADWVVPHFEKMLYDNALLLRVYAHWARRTGDPLAFRVAAQTAEFLLTDLADGDLFTSSRRRRGRNGRVHLRLDAGAADRGSGRDDGRWAAALFAVTDAGTFEHGSSVLQLLAEPDDPRASNGFAALCSTPAAAGCSRARRQRWSRRGTGSPSRRSSKPAWRSTTLACSTRPFAALRS